jgi:succinyl-diaminopimelate desuccinylase
MNDQMAAVDRYIKENGERFEEDLCELLRIDSVSTDPAFKASVERAGNWVVEHFKQIGLAAELWQTPGAPVVFAETPKVDGAPTVLVYGHYDVQPPDPLELWKTPPFEPTRRDGNIVARGATDDKGQMLTHVKSVEAWMKTVGRAPVNVKFIIEGEEEVGSESLGDVLEAKADRLACDCVVISDTSQFGDGLPAITYGLRGIAYFELRLFGPNRDLHSGTFGGSVANPANGIAKMLAALVDDDGRICVPEFYDDVVLLSGDERRQFAELPFSDDAYCKQLGVNATAGEKDFSTLERRWVRPTCDVHGLKSGYQGDGSKTVLPATAMAKFSFRLVPNQDPVKIAKNLRTMLEKITPPGLRMELIDFHGAEGVVTPLDSPFMAAAARAIEFGFGRAPVFIREGGSIPIVTSFKRRLGVDSLLLGWGRDDDNTHSPNEKFNLADFHRGIRASANLWMQMARL